MLKPGRFRCCFGNEIRFFAQTLCKPARGLFGSFGLLAAHGDNQFASVGEIFLKKFEPLNDWFIRGKRLSTSTSKRRRRCRDPLQRAAEAVASGERSSLSFVEEKRDAFAGLLIFNANAAFGNCSEFHTDGNRVCSSLSVDAARAIDVEARRAIEMPFLRNEFDLPALGRDLRCDKGQRIFEELNEGVASCVRGQDHLTRDLRRFLFAAPQSLALAELPPGSDKLTAGRFGQCGSQRKSK